MVEGFNHFSTQDKRQKANKDLQNFSLIELNELFMCENYEEDF